MRCNGNRRFNGISAALFFGGVFSIGFATNAIGADSCDTPIPTDAKIQAAPKGLRTEQAAFLGAWGNGKWDNNLCNTLIVEEISPGGNVALIYSWGNYSGWNVREGSLRTVGRFDDDNKLQFTLFGGSVVVTYAMDGNSLQGTYERTYSGYDGSPQKSFSNIVLDRKPSAVQ